MKTSDAPWSDRAMAAEARVKELQEQLDALRLCLIEADDAGTGIQWWLDEHGLGDFIASFPASGEDGRRPFASDLPDSPGKSGEAESTEMSMSVSPESSPARRVWRNSREAQP